MEGPLAPPKGIALEAVEVRSVHVRREDEPHDPAARGCVHEVEVLNGGVGGNDSHVVVQLCFIDERVGSAGTVTGGHGKECQQSDRQDSS